ncbi:hypothetical protein BD413DRAFT_46779 [Trametes elegans]|nr:hypothetical protein BD413DRAFT_46779 [Trametes elegans]
MSTSRHIGTLIVVVLKAVCVRPLRRVRLSLTSCFLPQRNLPNKRHIGKQDPYCQVIFNGEKRRTKAIKRGGQHPEWDEEIRFELYEDTDDIPHIPELAGDGPPPPPPPKSAAKGPPKVKGGKFMALACYAEDPREPDLIGETKVDLTEVLTKGETDEWFTVMHKEKYCGEVYLELTFWLDEPPPAKKVNHKANGQYGGRGTFVPIGDSASSSLTDLDRYSVSSRLSASSTRDEIRRENLPPSLRSSNSRLDIYVAPYESTRSHNSSVDGVVNEFAELRVDGGGNRRQSMPTGSYMQRPASSLGLPDPYANGAPPSHHQSTFSEGDGSYQYNVGGRPRSFHQDSAPLPDPYQPAYEQQNPAPSGFQPPHSRPRYSLPPTSSGFAPLPTPAPSGFMPLSPNLPQSTGFHPPPSATPAPYGAPVPSRVPSSSFSTYPPQPVTSSGFAPPTQQPPTSSFPPPFTPSSSMYYPPSQTPASSAYSQQGQHSPSTYSQHNSSLPPSSSFPHNPPPPSTSFPQNLPTSSFPHNPPHSSYPIPSASTPPHAQQLQYPHSPSTPSIGSHSHPVPPEHQQYPQPLTSSPSHSHDHIPPPPPLTDSPSRGPQPGSRPLPQPQAPSGQPFAQRARRQSSLPVPPPPNSQGYYNGAQTQNPPAFPSAFQSIPPPPPLPQQHQQPQSSFLQNGQQLASPGPPPPLPSSQFSQGPTPAPPMRRPSLPPPPTGYQNQQQSAYQALPPPPPPPSLPSHLQYEPTSSFAPPAQGQSYYPGPPPRPPQYLPPSSSGSVHGGYPAPIPQGQEYASYGQ